MVSYLQFYLRKDVQEAILKAAKDREVAFKFGDTGFGKRPEILQFGGDVFELAKQGVTSFHLSEERWSNPLDLNTGMRRKDLDELRSGWDLILDIDGPFELSRIAAKLLIDAIKFHDIESFTIKFSGNRGFHIAIPFESFPNKVHNEDTKNLFPEGPRKIAVYLSNFIKEKLKEKLLEKYSIKEILEMSEKKDVQNESTFNPFSVVDVDTVLISSRHMFRAPYSINEKSGLASIPIDPDKIDNFKKDDAKPENVKVESNFLETNKISDASKLIIAAFDQEWTDKLKAETNKRFQKEKSDAVIFSGDSSKRKFAIPSQPIKADFFPPCILKIMSGIPEDGRKRALFILLNFLKSCGWSIDDIKDFVLEKWNKKNYELLRDGYIISQISWHKRQSKNILPPNCENKAYYQDLRFCSADGLCGKIRNPVNYSLRKLRLLNRNKKSKKYKR